METFVDLYRVEFEQRRGPNSSDEFIVEWALRERLEAGTVPQDVGVGTAATYLKSGEGEGEGEGICFGYLLPENVEYEGDPEGSLPDASTGSGTILLRFNPVSMSITVHIEHPFADATSAHIHAADGSVSVDLGNASSPIDYTFTPEDIELVFTNEDAAAFVDIHTSTYPLGAVRGMPDCDDHDRLTWRCPLDFASENVVPPPAVTESASGAVDITFDVGSDAIFLEFSVEHAIADATDFHVHGAEAGENGDVLFDLGPAASPIQTGFVVPQNNEHSGPVYLDIHSGMFPDGVLRADLSICDPMSLTQEIHPGEYSPGGIIEISATVEHHLVRPPSSLTAVHELPQGWTFVELVSATREPELAPNRCESGQFTFQWTSPPGGEPFTYAFSVAVPPPAEGDVYARITAFADMAGAYDERVIPAGEAGSGAPTCGTAVDLTIAATGPGTTSPDPGTHSFELDEIAYVTAISAADAVFVRWEGDISNQNPTASGLALPMTESRSITALFVHNRELNISVTGAGQTVPAAGTHVMAHGTQIDMYAIPAFGGEFMTWIGDIGGANPNYPALSFFMNEARNIEAVFRAYDWTVGVDINGEGRVRIGGQDFSGGVIQSFDGTWLSLEASPLPGTGFAFAGWTGDIVSEAPSVSLIVDSDKSLAANFVDQDVRTLTLLSSPGGVVTPQPGAYAYTEGWQAFVSAYPQDWFHQFSGWTGDIGDSNAMSFTLQLTMDRDRTVGAEFQEIASHTFTIARTGDGTVYPAPGSYPYPEGMWVAGTAVGNPASGQVFSRWEGDVGAADPHDSQIVVLMDQDRSLTAVFEVPERRLLVEVLGGGVVNVFTLGFVDSASVEFQVADGHHVGMRAEGGSSHVFARWFGDIDEADPFNPEISVTMGQDRTVAAAYQPVAAIDCQYFGSGAEFHLSNHGPDYFIHERFSDLEAPLGGIQWWGTQATQGEGENLEPCLRNPNDFEIVVRADANGQPGDELFRHSFDEVAGSYTGESSGDYPIYKFYVEFEECIPAETGWISVRGVTDEECWFYWGGGVYGDSDALRENPAGGLDSLNADAAYCLLRYHGPPVITLNGDAVLSAECHAPFTDPGATAIDDCQFDISQNIQVSPALILPEVGDYTLVYSVTDAAGNLVQAERLVEVRDTRGPYVFSTDIIYVEAVADENCTALVPDLEPFVDLYGDECGNPVSVGQSITAGTPALNGETGEMYFEDQFGNVSILPFVMDLQDVIAPEIRVGEAVEAWWNPELYILDVEVQDDCTPASFPNLSQVLEIADSCGIVDVVQSIDPGTPFIDPQALATIVAVDSLGNMTSRYVLLNFVPLHRSNLELVGGSTLVLECGDTFTDPGVIARNACGQDIQDRVTQLGSVDPDVPGNYCIRYSLNTYFGQWHFASRNVAVGGNGCEPPTAFLTHSGGVDSTSLRIEIWSYNSILNGCDSNILHNGDTVALPAGAHVWIQPLSYNRFGDSDLVFLRWEEGEGLTVPTGISAPSAPFSTAGADVYRVIVERDTRISPITAPATGGVCIDNAPPTACQTELRIVGSTEVVPFVGTTYEYGIASPAPGATYHWNVFVGDQDFGNAIIGPADGPSIQLEPYLVFADSQYVRWKNGISIVITATATVGGNTYTDGYVIRTPAFRLYAEYWGGLGGTWLGLDANNSVSLPFEGIGEMPEVSIGLWTSTWLPYPYTQYRFRIGDIVNGALLYEDAPGEEWGPLQSGGGGPVTPAQWPYEKPAMIGSNYQIEDFWEIEWEQNPGLYGGKLVSIGVDIMLGEAILPLSFNFRINPSLFIVGENDTGAFHDYMETVLSEIQSDDPSVTLPEPITPALFAEFLKALFAQETDTRHFATKARPLTALSNCHEEDPKYCSYSSYASYPGYPLRENGPNHLGYGIAQLSTSRLVSHYTHVWDWRTNVRIGVEELIEYIATAWNRLANSKYPERLASVPESYRARWLLLEIANSYNGGITNRYWWWNSASSNVSNVELRGSLLGSPVIASIVGNAAPVSTPVGDARECAYNGWTLQLAGSLLLQVSPPAPPTVELNNQYEPVLNINTEPAVSIGQWDFSPASGSWSLAALERELSPSEMRAIATDGFTIECQTLNSGEPVNCSGRFYLNTNAGVCPAPDRQVLPAAGWVKFGYVRPVGSAAANAGYHDYNNDGVRDNGQNFCIPSLSGLTSINPPSGNLVNSASRYADRIVWRMNDQLGGARPCGDPN